LQLEVRARKFTERCRYELIEPLKPIVYYIDPAPEKWKYIGQGIDDWQIAFAGWALFVESIQKMILQ
jgi:hypothetical protein